MGQRGPKPLPTRELERRGSWLAKLRTAEPTAEPLTDVPTCPDWVVAEGAELWDGAIGHLVRNGVVTGVDLQAFAMACHAWTIFHAARRIVEKKGVVSDTAKGGGAVHPAYRVMDMSLSRVLQILREYGLTPSSRSQIVALCAPEPAADNPVARLVRHV